MTAVKFQNLMVLQNAKCFIFYFFLINDKEGNKQAPLRESGFQVPN